MKTIEQQAFQHDIFLSYASEDRERITVLVKTMESLGWSVWWDQRIPTGREFDEFIEEQLEASKSVVVVWSNTSIKKRWVKTEAKEGLDRNVLFPVMIDDVRIPLEFRRLQAANLVQWQGDESHGPWSSLVQDLSKVLGTPTSSAVRDKKRSKDTVQDIVEPTQQKRVGQTISQSSRKESKQEPEGMVLIPKGPFLYGDEKKKVIIDHDYYMDVQLVTNADFAKFIKAGGYETESYWTEEGWQWRKEENIRQPEFWKDQQWNQADQPVVGVSYYEVEAYAKWAGKRLPTEQEWEKAARGTDGREHPWGEEFDAGRCAASVGKARDRTVPVGSYPEGQSPYGCHDMAGNVWEWCASWYDEGQVRRVLRGGSWFDTGPELFSCAFRGSTDPRGRGDVVGFRCAQDAP